MELMDGGIQSYQSYFAALLDYVSGSGELGLARAYEIGRTWSTDGRGLLQILVIHHKAVNTLLESTPADYRLKRLNASEEFLMEALSTFEITSRGYLALIEH